MGFTRSTQPARPDPSGHIDDAKAHLRKAIKERLDRLPEDQRQAESRTLCRELLPYIPKGSTVAAYFPLKTEASLRPLLRELLARGDTVFLPRFEDNKMVCRQMLDEESLLPGAFTIPEPPKSAPLLDFGSLDFALIPGRAFDKTGGRLGRGNGGYDRWIRKLKKENNHVKIIGIALECQMVHEIPRKEHDEMMDAIATARGITECGM